jgi:hypothetical protein
MVIHGGLDADMILGTVGPSGAVATVEKVAANAVMAGCLPDYFPVLIAAVRAVCNPEFDLAEVQNTTHSLGPLIIVNGPVREVAGIASGWGALGPGHRANATIGRALRLVMQNIGGARPGISDMALLGQPGKYTLCLAEAEELSPFPPLHTSLGFLPELSAVTIVGVGPPQSVACITDKDDETSADRLLRIISRTIATVGSNNAWVGLGTVVVALNIEHAQVLATARHDRESIQATIVEFATNRVGDIRLVSPNIWKDRHEDDRISAVRSPDRVIVIVAGGGGIYSAVMQSWGGGPHHNKAVTAEIELSQACDIPGVSQRWLTPRRSHRTPHLPW